MKANELADKLDNFYSYVNEPYLLVKTSAMLRQQAQEIEELKQQLEKERNIYAYALYKKASEK
jgi:hypothetical protein